MKSRDFVLLGAIVVVAGFAVADAFRGDGGEVTTTEPARTEVEPPAAFEPLPLAGSLVFTDARDCRLRRITMASGAETPLPFFAGDCTLWAAPSGSAVAYGLGGGRLDVAPFRLVDLAAPGERLGAHQALFGYVAWSPDGRRVAWCGPSRAGFDLELGDGTEKLADCPAGYTPAGQVAVAGRALA